MSDLQQNLTPVPPTPTKPNDNTKGIIGTILGIVGFFILGIPLGTAAIILGAIEQPKTGWSWAAIIIGIVDIVALLALLSY
jgi:hypothetical protein